jgi:alkylation response protein AidB-like acyl-CoA dehydrogenase
LNEESASFLAEDVKLTASRSGDGWKLNGCKLFVADAAAATSVLVIARTGDAAANLTAFLVDMTDIQVELDETTAGDQLGALFFDGVEVSDSARFGEVNGAWPSVERALAIGQLGLAAYTLGLAQQALEMAVEYAKTRVQFGVPIGSFQALQHKMADRSTEIDGLRFLVYHAAWNADIGLPFDQDARKAKAFAGMICRQTALDCAHMFGGYGMVVETDIQLYYRRLRMTEVRFGQHDEMLEAIAVGLDL